MADYELLTVFKEPCCLIETDPDGKLNIRQNILDEIGEIDLPLNIVCIAGPYRTGKSYLLTRLAGVNAGFPLGNTIESATKGIWVWCRPHPVNRDQVLLLLDTEGLGDIEKGDPNHDNRILVLGILLSSTLVYNILGKFSNDDLEKLSFVTELSKTIQFSDKMSVDHSRSNFHRVFPTFILAVRDCVLEMSIQEDHQQTKKTTPITNDEYLERICLSLQDEKSPKEQASNNVRRCLREYFKTRKCFTFNRPGGKSVLMTLEKLTDKDLDDGFIEESKKFTHYVHHICPPKHIGDGHPINGRQFVMLAQTYVDAIREGKVPNVENARTTMVRMENTRAVEESVRIYQSGMNKLKYPTRDINTLPAEHAKCFDAALDFFRRNSWDDKEKKYYDLAISGITKAFENFTTRDQEESAKKSQKALKEMDAVIEQKVKDGCYSRAGGYQLYLKDMKKLETDYDAHTELGCKKQCIIDEYQKEVASRGLLILQCDKALTLEDKEIEDIFTEEGTKMADYELLTVFKEPCCLIETDPDGKLNIRQNILDEIGEIDLPLNIVCIAGPYRTGKSYLLTRLAGVNAGFPLGNTIESATKGIWVWCRPHPVNRDQVLLLLDTEGLGDIKKGDPNHDNRILVLGILLSSTLVYNILGKFSNDDLEKLSFVTELSKTIQFSDKMSVDHSRSNFDRVFPTFILALRDFVLEMSIQEDHQQTKKTTPITNDEYLERICLSLQDEKSPKEQASNNVRRCLREYFKTRKCFTFDRPGGKSVLMTLEKLTDKDLDDGFIEESKKFTHYVHHICPPKHIGDGHPINGRQFVMLAQTYVDAIREGKVPNVENARTTMVRMENTRAVEESVRIYQSGMNKLKYPTLDINTLPAEHAKCFDAALDFFRRNSWDDKEKKYYDLAISGITKAFENFTTRDQEDSAKKSQKALKEMDAVIEQKVKDGCYSRAGGYQLYLKDMKKLETDYDAHTELGCKKQCIIDEYQKEVASRGLLILQCDKALTLEDKEIEAERQTAAEAERQRRAEVSLLEEKQRQHEETMRLYKAEMEKQKEKEQYELQKRIDHIEKIMQQRFDEQIRLEKEGFRKDAEKAKLESERLQRELDESKSVGIIRKIWRAIW